MHMLGRVTLFGSGETTASGGRVFEALAGGLGSTPVVAVLETPAGFEANAAQVAGRVSGFLTSRLQNFQARVEQVAARKRGTPCSPDEPAVVAPLFDANLIFLGPGSPTYAVRQLAGSLAWHALQARHRLGATVVFASAAAIAAGSPALPVYEIFKVGEDPHWKPGLDFFAPFGLRLTVVPHWNNQDGGAGLDTSRCFIGRERFSTLLAELPPGRTVLGIDELTAVTFDFAARECQVDGPGSAHVLRAGQQADYPSGSRFPLAALGDYCPPDDLSIGLPPEVWARAQFEPSAPVESPPAASPHLDELVAAREAARQARDWALADRLRAQIAALGWQVIDSPDGPRLQPR
jgi:cyanophycinase-like exopeptidase